MLAVTGTDGKTSTTLWAVEMLEAGGVHTVASGNTEVPLVEAVDRDDLDVFVVECTNHRLATAETFRGEVAAWINFAPDHLNWHRSVATYEAAKARLFAQQREHGRGHRRRRRSDGDAPPRRRPWHATHVRLARRRLRRVPGGRAARAARCVRDGRQPAPGAAPRRDERAVRRRTRARVRSWSAPTPSPPGWPRSAGRRTASSSSATPTGSAGTTIRRRRRHTPRRRRSGRSTTSC